MAEETKEKDKEKKESKKAAAEKNQPQVKGTIKTRMAILVFIKDVATPMVLYFDNAQKIYEDLKALINSTEIKMVEFEPVGPIKRAAILSDKIMSVAIQEERYLTQE